MQIQNPRNINSDSGVNEMENRAVFLEVVGENQSTSDFLLLYQQSVLLALREQGVLDECQYEFCLDTLGKQRIKKRKKGGET